MRRLAGGGLGGGYPQVTDRFILKQPMPKAHFLSRLLMHNRHVRIAREISEEALGRVHRLEIQLGRALDKIEALEGRLNARGGVLGGRPRKGLGTGTTLPLRLEDIPKGDKAALREYFRLNPPKPDTPQEH